jgi:hypothetical protein
VGSWDAWRHASVDCMDGTEYTTRWAPVSGSTPVTRSNGQSRDWQSALNNISYTIKLYAERYLIFAILPEVILSFERPRGTQQLA